jgi:hypothetical protein
MNAVAMYLPDKTNGHECVYAFETAFMKGVVTSGLLMPVEIMVASP